MRVELAIVEAQVGFADQPITDLGVVVVGQYQLRGQREKRQADFRKIAGVMQFDARIVEPRLLIEQLQNQRKHRTVEQIHVQLLELRTLQQFQLQIAQPGAIDVQHPTVLRQARRLDLRLARPVMAAGQLNAVDAQRRTQPFHQICLQR
ncbi:hypothetical protein D3C78_929990 [compost metagenome]